MPPRPRAERHIARLQVERYDNRPDQRVARRAAKEERVLSLDELRSCGLSKDEITTRVVNGRFHRQHAGVYVVGPPGLPLAGRFLAAVKACGNTARLSHHAAGVHLGFLEWEERLVDVTVEGTTTRRHPGIRVHRTTALDFRDFTRHDGIPITTPARTLLDLAGTRLPDAGLRRAVRRAQATHRVNLRQLAEVLRRHPGRRGAARLAALLATGPEPARSDLEDLVLDLLRHHRFERPDVNEPLWIDGRRVIPDFRWRAQRLVLEADGVRWHGGPLAEQDDAERQALLEAHGERVLRVTGEQIVRRPAQTARRLEAAGAPRGRP